MIPAPPQAKGGDCYFGAVQQPFRKIDSHQPTPPLYDGPFLPLGGRSAVDSYFRFRGSHLICAISDCIYTLR